MLERKEMKKQHPSFLIDTRPRGDFTQPHTPTKCILDQIQILDNIQSVSLTKYCWENDLSVVEICQQPSWLFPRQMISFPVLGNQDQKASRAFLELINVGGKSPFSHHYLFYISSCLTLCGTQNFGTYNVQKSLKYMLYAENLGCCCSIQLLDDVAFIPLWVRSAFHCLPFMWKGGREN